jgi:branched-chain amino acid transport system permease protein
MGKKNYIGVIVLVLVIILIPYTFKNKYYLSVLVNIGIFSLITMGLSLLMGYAGQISLGQAGFFALGAYTSTLLSVDLGMSPWLAVFPAMILSAVIAFLIGIPTLRLKGHYLAMATLGFGEIVHITATAAVDLTGGPSGIANIPRFYIGSMAIKSPMQQFYFVFAIVVILLILSLNIIHSRVGRALRSIHGGEMAANASGVNTARYKVYIFALAAVYASIAGSLSAHFINFVDPSPYTLHKSILFVTMVVVGGMTNIWGALMGTALLWILPEYLGGAGDYEILVYGSILLIVVMFMPKGLFFSLRHALEKVVKRRKAVGDTPGN